MTSQYSLTMALVGSAGSGKTGLMRVLAGGRPREGYHPTVAMQLHEHVCLLDQQLPVRLQVWEVAGREQHRVVARALIDQAHLLLVCFDAACRDSFEAGLAWQPECLGRRALLLGLRWGGRACLVPAGEAARAAQRMACQEYLEVAAEDPGAVKRVFKAVAGWTLTTLDEEALLRAKANGRLPKREKEGCL
jgi:hypothetical protein